jgi:DNA-binding transcriptional MerR regulator
MFTIEETAKAVGLSERQLRRRVEATAPLLAPYVRRGEKNRLLFDQGAVEILRDVEARRASGATLTDAKDWVAVSLRGEHGGEQGQERGQTAGTSVPQSGEVAVLRELIDELKRDRDHWRSMAENLQVQLALPAPKAEEPRRPWIMRLLRPLVASR